MIRLRPKHPRVKLHGDCYIRLCRRVLERDNWRCQNCGSASELQIHHIQFRSRMGDDSERNLITLCAACHKDLHRGYVKAAAEHHHEAAERHERAAKHDQEGSKAP